MILTSSEIDALNIVDNPVPLGKRRTSYDATVGEIISNGTVIDGQRFKLPSRGIAWVVSHETYRMPNNVTGIATLRTTWTKQGILALNVGVIDPEWSGSLSAAIVNFSNDDFIISKGEPFFRVVFQKHMPTNGPSDVSNRNEYIASIIKLSIRTKDSFLNISKLSDEVSGKIFGSSSWASRITLWALIVGIVAIFFPVSYGICVDYIAHKNELSILDAKIQELTKTQNVMETKIDDLIKSTHHE